MCIRDRLRNAKQAAQLLREQVAAIMTADEIHEDVHRFFSKLVALTKPVG